MAKQREGTNVVDIIDPPPARFKISREAWAATPAVIREEIARMLAELNKGFEMYASASKRDADMADFHDMAKAAGKSLPDVIREFIAIENFVRAEPVRAIEHLATRYNFDLEAFVLQKLKSELEVA
jgi:hypothetical protein